MEHTTYTRPDGHRLTVQAGKVWFECTIGSAAGETRSVEQGAARQLDKLNNFLLMLKRLIQSLVLVGRPKPISRTRNPGPG